MTIAVRRLAAEDAEASRALGWEAFGSPAGPPTETAAERLARPGATQFGVFDGSRLVAQLTWRDYDSWFGGGLVRTAGIASVTVAAEYRGRGLLTRLFADAVADAKSAGAVISTLFPSAPGIYRRFGYELVADYTTVSVPTWALASVRRPDRMVTTRRAELADVPAVRGVYDRWAAAQNGPLSRRGVSFPTNDADLLTSFTGVTIAVDEDGEVCGYASWNRGQGYGPDAVLEISDLLALSGDGCRALLGAMGSFGSVTPTTRIDTSGADPIRLLLPVNDWRPTHTDPYMLAVLDVAGALGVRSYPPGIGAELSFALAGSPDRTQDGTYVLRVADGAGACEPTTSTVAADRVLAPRGLALLYAGMQTSANLRFAGLLSGGEPGQDPLWDCLFTARPMHIRDYF